MKILHKVMYLFIIPVFCREIQQKNFIHAHHHVNFFFRVMVVQSTLRCLLHNEGTLTNTTLHKSSLLTNNRSFPQSFFGQSLSKVTYL